MDAVDYILEGLEAELALERELGVRTFEIDRALLVTSGASDASEARAARVASDARAASEASVSSDARVSRVSRDSSVSRASRDSSGSSAASVTGASSDSGLSYAFLHDKPLSAKGVEMMAKIITALGKTHETAPIVIAPPVPKAKTYVVLGGLALRKWFPGKNVAPGQRFTSDKGAEVLVTYSPEYILRFSTMTPALKKIKQDMWNSLKALNRT